MRISNKYFQVVCITLKDGKSELINADVINCSITKDGLFGKTSFCIKKKFYKKERVKYIEGTCNIWKVV